MYNEEMSAGNPEQDYVLKTVKSRDVHFIRCWFTDILGHLKSFAMVPGEMENAFSEGMAFDGRNIDGFSNDKCNDLLAFPEASTFQVLPWRPQQNAVGRMFCSIKTPDGVPFEGDPRYVLMKVLDRAADAGLNVIVGSDVEYFYFKSPDSTEVLDNGGYFDLTSLDNATDLRRDTVLALEKMGIPVEYSHHEAAPSQHEIDLRYSDALSMADAVMTYKLVVKEIALKHGVYASFMPKPLSMQPGSGMHIHISLMDDDGQNIFYDPDDPEGFNLSHSARSFIAGILKHAKELCLLTNQYVNSYKRFAGLGHASSAIMWSRDNAAAMVRIPTYRPHSADSCRIEICNPDPAANPYLAIAGIVSAGLSGIENNYKLEAQDPSIEICGKTREELGGLGIECLPETLRDAIDAFESSGLLKDALGEHIHSYLVSIKRAEWDSYQQIVTPWEHDRFLAVL